MSSKMKERLHTGEIYLPGDDEILEEQFQCQEKLYDYNQTRPSEGEKRSKLLKEMFAEIGDGCYIEPPLRANWGGHFVHFGKNIYANFNLTLVDDTHIYVGDATMFGPNVTPLLQQGIRFFQNFGSRHTSIICLFALGKIAGWGPGLLLCRELPLEIIRLLGPEA